MTKIKVINSYIFPSFRLFSTLMIVPRDWIRNVCSTMSLYGFELWKLSIKLALNHDLTLGRVCSSIYREIALPTKRTSIVLSNVEYKP